MTKILIHPLNQPTPLLWSNFHRLTEWVNFAWMQDLYVLLKLDSISWLKTLENNSVQWPVVNTLCQETKKHHNQKVGSEWTPKLGPCWKLQLVACTVSTKLRSEWCLWTETFLTLGSEFLMDHTSLSWIWTTMKKKFQKISSKNMRGHWMRRIMHADQRPKQNHKEENLPALHQE